MKIIRSCILPIVLLTAPHGDGRGWAQVGAGEMQADAAADGYTIHVDARLVVLDVVVVDRKGKSVTGLRREDFRIFEDQQPQTITSFDLPEEVLPAKAVQIHSTADLDRLAPEAPVNIIVLDEINTRFEDMAFARYALKKYLSLQPEALHTPTQLVAAGLHRLTVLHDYTTDRQAILDALEHHFTQYPWHLESGSRSQQQFTSAFSALTQVAEATMGHRGHKEMIWVGRGFPSIHQDQLAEDEAYQLHRGIEQCVNRLRDARVTLYTVDPQGLSSSVQTDIDGFDAGDPFGGNIDFNTLSAATGGRSFYGRNDVDAEIGQSLRDGNSFYTLAYRPGNNLDAAVSFRRIRVQMSNPQWRAFTREGYYAIPPVRPVAESKSVQGNITYDLLAAAGTRLIYDGIPLAVTHTQDDPYELQMELDGKALQWTDEAGGGRSAKVQFLIASFDANDRLLHRSAQIITIRETEEMQDPQGMAGTVFLRMRLAQGIRPARVRVVARDALGGRMGTANLDFTE
jgi:VWFA-related protein